MGGYYNVYSVKGKKIFHYRFTCGKCHKTTPWSSCCIRDEYAIQTKSSLSDQIQRQLENGLSKKLNDRIYVLKREVADGYFFSQPSMRQSTESPCGKCPYCGQNPKRKGAVFEAGLISGVIGLFVGLITSAVLAGFYIFETFTPMIAITIASTVAGIVMGAVIKSRFERRLVVHTNVEYWWNEVLPINKF